MLLGRVLKCRTGREAVGCDNSLPLAGPALGAGAGGDYRARLVAIARGNTVTGAREAA